MKDTLVRWITRWDKEGVTQLLAANARAHDFQTAQESLVESFEFSLKQPETVRFCVAVRNGEVLAMASLHRAYSTWRGRPFGTIEDVFVREDARRTGLATALLEFLRTEAVRRGYACLRLDVQAGNASARALYEKFGMEDTGYVVYELDFDKPVG